MQKFLEYLKTNWRKMIPFALVGGIFNLIELGGTFYFVKYMEFPLRLTYAICFIVATIVAYTLNSFFTFNSKFNFVNFIKYFSIYMVAMLIGQIVILIFQSFTEFPDEIYPFIAAPFVYIWNFTMTNRFLERKEE